MTTNDRKVDRVKVKIRLERPNEVPIQHANNIFVSHTDDEFFITFAQVHPPYLLEPTKEEVEELKVAGLPARVVARLMVSPIKMKEFIEALSDNYKKYKARKED